jgi:hypothetical protein
MSENEIGVPSQLNCSLASGNRAVQLIKANPNLTFGIIWRDSIYAFKELRSPQFWRNLRFFDYNRDHLF